MRAGDVRVLFEYSYAATARLLSAAEGLSNDEFATAPPLRGSRSVQETLVHTLDTEQGWRENLRAGRHEASPVLDPEDFPSVAVLADAWRADERRMFSWLESLDDATLNADAFNGRILWQCLAHVVNHSTQHRSEVAMLITHFGHSPGDLDLTDILRG